ncbi:tetratricopeptide repeat-containing sensor histidine kinase [Neotamlana laminarinivorans]|uniref:Histidine kinase n=1 Tax=Neotamlana laminarinivorans TaxID=2883124 RepID=A0A9X1HZ59_9FLAO|nr:histidine kinase [Tamlana laminarinivorans]MCB4798451.1 histidine kinase [Tamlana laminarinivorans]
MRDMLKFWLVICIAFFANTINAQTSSKTDSLLTLLKNHPQKDSIRVKYLINTAFSLLYTAPDSTLLLSQQALEISKQQNLKQGLYLSYSHIGMAYYQNNSYKKAISNYFKALNIAEDLNNTLFQSRVHSNLANIYADFGEFNKALNSYKKSFEIAKTNSDTIYQIIALANIGVLQSERDSLIDLGILNLKQALNLAEKIKHEQYITFFNLNLGLSFKKKKEYIKAINYYKEVLNFNGETKKTYDNLLAYNNLSTASFEIKDYKATEFYANKALDIAKEFNDLEWQSSAWATLSEVYSAKNKYKLAFQAYQNYSELKDSLDLINTKAEILKLQDDYKHDKEKLLLTAKHDKENLLNLQEINNQKAINRIIVISAITILVLLFLGFYVYKRKQESQFNLKVAETELKALRAQMNPHFIFNALNSVSKYITSNNSNLANNFLIKFSNLMRQTLENSEKKDITVKEDLQLLKNYLEIECKRFVNGFKYKIEVDEELNSENVLVPPMLLQPFVENSIWHGISKMNGSGCVTIEAKVQNDMLCYTVDDNGVGRKNPNGKRHNSKSMGISITQNRIDILNKQKKANGNLKIIDKDKGTRVEITLPFQTLFSNG